MTTWIERRQGAAAEIVERTGIDEEMIERLVRAFYAKVRADPVLGPIFAARITDWEPHLQRICAFWSSVVLLTGRYHGRPMEQHHRLPIAGEHFDRWLALFGETAQGVCPPAAAAHFAERARHIGKSLEFGIAASRGIFLKEGERLGAPEAGPPQQP